VRRIIGALFVALFLDLVNIDLENVRSVFFIIINLSLYREELSARVSVVGLLIYHFYGPKGPR
jgi:hypothetical protein